MDGNTDGVPREEEEEEDDMLGYLVLSLDCLTGAMFLVRRTDSAAPQSMKAKVAPFHNFILERGGALKLCGGERERERERGREKERERGTVKHQDN